jgi:hypothetical protein
VTTFETVKINETRMDVTSQLSIFDKSILDSGALGIKVWKNIGMSIKNKRGQRFYYDRWHPVFDPDI